MEKRDKSEIEEYQHLEASEKKKREKDQKKPVWEKTEPREVIAQEFQEAETNQQSMSGR